MKLLYNARIHTCNQKQPTASALLIDDGGWVVAVGGQELIEAFPFAQKENLNGKTIWPGLTDAHIHLQQLAFALQKVNVETPTKAEALQRVAKQAQTTPPGTWILGHGWQQNDWGGLFGSAIELDQAAAQHPVYLTAKSLHAGWLNTAGMQAAGITSSTPDPENGKIIRDERGQPTGILLESAMSLAEKAIPQPNTEQVAAAIRAAQPVLHQMGLTGAHDFDYRPCLMALQLLRERDELQLRVVKSVPPDLLEHAHGLGLRSGFGDDLLRIGSYKAFMDGALGPRTAAMFQPYLNQPENRGILNLDAEELFEMGRKASETGLSMAVHAIGDRAVHEVLNAYEHLRAHEKAQGLPPARHRIEHVQVIHPDDAGRLAKLNIIASMQPIHATSDMLAADQYWGERAELSYAWRTQLSYGAQLAFGSDAPVESPNPFLGLYAAVSRRRADGTPGPDGWYAKEKLTLEEALAGYTTGAAYAAHQEKKLGKLAPGCLADLIVLEQDPFMAPSEALLTTQPSATMFAGQWVWQA